MFSIIKNDRGRWVIVNTFTGNLANNGKRVHQYRFRWMAKLRLEHMVIHFNKTVDKLGRGKLANN